MKVYSTSHDSLGSVMAVGDKGTELGQQKAPSWQVQDMHHSGPLWKVYTQFAFSTHGLVFLSLFLFLLPSFCSSHCSSLGWIGKGSPKVQTEVLSPSVMACANHGRESDSEDRASWLGIVPLWRAPTSCLRPPCEQYPGNSILQPGTQPSGELNSTGTPSQATVFQNFWKINDMIYKWIFQCMVLGKTSWIDIVTSAFSGGP